MAVLLKGKILPIGGVASVKVCAQHAWQAYFLGKMLLLIHLHFNPLINRPGAAGAVLQTPL